MTDVLEAAVRLPVAGAAAHDVLERLLDLSDRERLRLRAELATSDEAAKALQCRLGDLRLKRKPRNRKKSSGAPQRTG
jgi:hypothetical protein